MLFNFYIDFRLLIVRNCEKTIIMYTTLINQAERIGCYNNAMSSKQKERMKNISFFP